MNTPAEVAERILVLAPSGNDAANAAMVLHRAGMSASICRDCGEIEQQLKRGAGAILVAEEALVDNELACLSRIVKSQPPWSDISLLIITQGRETDSGRWLDFVPDGNVTLMERPFHAVALTSALNTALRARRRQYQVRDFLEEQQKTMARIRADEQRFRAVFNQQFQFMAILSPEGIVWEINDLPLLTSGIKREEALGKLFWETPFWAHLPQMRTSWPERLAQASRSNGPILSVDQFVTATGDLRVADAAVTAVKTSDGKVEFFIIQASDITERTRAEAALRETSQRYQRLFESIDVGFCLIEMIFDENEHPLDYRFLEINPAFEKQTGLRDAEGKRMRELAPAHEQTWFDTYGKIALTGASIRFQSEAQALGRWFDLYAFAIPGPKPHKVGVLFTDITERKHAEEALRQSEERYRALVSQVQDYAIFTLDLHGRTSSYNDGVRRVFGWEEKEFIGEHFRRDFTQEDVEKGVPEKELEEARQHGRASNDRWMRRSNGDIFWASGVTTPLRDSKGETVGFIKVLRDLTEQKQLEQELQESRQKLQHHAEELEKRVTERTARLQETISELEAFSYSVSHDLRAPLRAMQGYSQILLEDYADNLDSTGRDFARRVAKAAERLDRLVSDILTYSRIGRADIQNHVIDVERLIQDIVHTYPTLREENADIDIQSPLLPVIGHEGSLTQCISNLLGNAAKFVHEKQKPHIRIWTEPRNGMVRINFKDNGIGIPPDHQQRIFQMFEKGPHGKQYEGTGIGLAIVRKAVERMGGDVGVHSSPGEGSLFWLDLPAAN